MQNWRLAHHKCLVSAVLLRLFFGGLCLVRVSLVATQLSRSVPSADLLYDDDDDDGRSRPNNDIRHHLHRRRHSDVATKQNNDDEIGTAVGRRDGSSSSSSSISRCSLPCRCSRPQEKLQCKGGVSIIRDGCNCCFVCARQQGDLCDFRHRCDEEKEEFCDYTLNDDDDDEDDDRLRGICRAQWGRGCQVEGGAVYADGDHFQLNCSQLCTCQDGQYACASLCPQEERAPSKDYCKDLQLITIAGRCCKEWVCPHSHTLPHQSKDDHDTTKLGDGASVSGDVRCVKETTGWSQCSVSCGFGWSVRLTNDNIDCLSVQERRLCIVRPCHLKDKHMQGRHCKTTWKESSPIRIRYDACVSLKDFRPKYCSTCKRKRCCRPHLTKSLLVDMLCTAPSAPTSLSTTLNTTNPLSPTNTSNTGTSNTGTSNTGTSNTTIVEKLMWVKSCRCKENYCRK